MSCLLTKNNLYNALINNREKYRIIPVGKDNDRNECFWLDDFPATEVRVGRDLDKNMLRST